LAVAAVLGTGAAVAKYHFEDGEGEAAACSKTGRRLELVARSTF